MKKNRKGKFLSDVKILMMVIKTDENVYDVGSEIVGQGLKMMCESILLNRRN